MKLPPIAALAALPAVAAAEENCGMRTEATEILSERYGESVVGVGILNADVVVEIWPPTLPAPSP